MKLIMLHGDHKLQSHDRLMKFIEVARSRNWDVYRSSDLTNDLTELLASDSLFEENKLVVIDDIREVTKMFTSWFNDQRDNLNGTLVIYNTNPLSKTFINQFDKVDANEEYKLPSLLWKFLDTLKSGESQRVLQRFHQVIEREATEFVFAMVSRQFKDMYLASSNAFRGPVWRSDKLKKQAEGFGIERLKTIIGKMAEIDVRTKTSKADLTSELDLLFVSF